MNIGKAIKETRKSLGIKQCDLCISCGISQTALSQIESGKVFPSQSNIKIISEALGVSVAAFYLLGIEKSDCPKENELFYDALMPSFKEIARKIFYTKTA